jgi:endogenous inhibitor of DNA gyrase (YacG/DUF329 family)
MTEISNKVQVKCSECEKTITFRSIKEAYFDGWDVKAWHQSDSISICICPECSKTAWVRD